MRHGRWWIPPWTLASVRWGPDEAVADAVEYEAVTNPVRQGSSDAGADAVEFEMVMNLSVGSPSTSESPPPGAPDKILDREHAAKRPKCWLRRALWAFLILVFAAAVAAAVTLACQVKVPLGHLRPSYATLVPVHRPTAPGDYRPDILLLVVDDLRIDDSRLPCYAPTMSAMATLGVTFSLANRYIYIGQITQ